MSDVTITSHHELNVRAHVQRILVQVHGGHVLGGGKHTGRVESLQLA